MTTVTSDHKMQDEAMDNDVLSQYMKELEKLELPTEPNFWKPVLTGFQNSDYLATLMWIYMPSPDASVVHASSTGQLQANPPVARPNISPGKSSRRTITTMGSNDLVVGLDHKMGTICKWYN